jgi:hypothetical protein
MSTPRYMQTGVPQGSILSLTLYNLYINDTHQTYFINLAPFADDTCLYVTESTEALWLCSEKTSACAKFNGGRVRTLEF